MPPDRRTRVLTDADLQALAEILQPGDSPIYRVNLTVEEGVLLKRILKGLDTTATWIGRTIVVAATCALIAAFTKGFWITLFEGISKIKTP